MTVLLRANKILFFFLPQEFPLKHKLRQGPETFREHTFRMSDRI